jgi:hypothetical protein
MTTPAVVKTFPGVDNGLWLDIVRDGPGQYSVHAIGNHINPIAEGFYLQVHAEEFVVDLQARQRGWVRIG